MEGSGGGELTVTVKGQRGDVPVRLTGEAVSGLVASFTPKYVGPHTLTAHYNNQPVPVCIRKIYSCNYTDLKVAKLATQSYILT